MTMLNYPGQRKIRVELLKIPESFQRAPSADRAQLPQFVDVAVGVAYLA